MKKLIITALILASTNCFALDDSCDTDHDGAIGGSEQYLCENPDSSDLTREQVTNAVTDARQQEEARAYAAELNRVAANQRASIAKSAADQQAAIAKANRTNLHMMPDGAGGYRIRGR